MSSTALFSQTKIIAHRGNSSVAPENTLTAFQKAIDCGAQYLELDVHKTKDDTVVVIHDDSVERTTSNNAKGKVEEMTYEELKKVEISYSKRFGDEYKGDKIPTLGEALKLCKGKIKVCIELKVEGVEEAVLKTVRDLNMMEEVYIFSFRYGVLQKMRALDPNIRIVYLLTKSNRRRIKMARKINARAIGVSFRTKITKKYLKRVHGKGLEVWKWTINREDKIRKHINVGLDGLITDYPELALEIKKGK